MAVLSTIRVIIGVFEAPEGSQFDYGLSVPLGALITIVIVFVMCSAFWFAGSVRVRHIKSEFPGTTPIPVVHVAGIAEDGNEVLTALGSTYSYKNLRTLYSPSAPALQDSLCTGASTTESRSLLQIA